MVDDRSSSMDSGAGCCSIDVVACGDVAVRKHPVLIDVHRVGTDEVHVAVQTTTLSRWANIKQRYCNLSTAQHSKCTKQHTKQVRVVKTTVGVLTILTTTWSTIAMRGHSIWLATGALAEAKRRVPVI